MSVQQQSAVTLLSRNNKLPKLHAGPLPSKRVPHLRLHALPRKDGNVVPIDLVLKVDNTPAEDSVTTAIPDTDGIALINQSLFTLFKQASASLIATREIYATTVEWIPIFTTTNLKDHAVNNTTEIDIGLTVGDTDVEASQLVHLRESFVDVTIHYGQTSHTFTKDETSEKNSTTVSYTVQGKTTVYGYQRKYTFKYRVWLDLKASNDGYNIGPDGEPRRQRVIDTTIWTEELLVVTTELPDETVEVEFDTVNPTSDVVERALDAETVNNIANKIAPVVKKA